MSTPSEASAPQTGTSSAMRDAPSAPHAVHHEERLDWLAGSSAIPDLRQPHVRSRQRFSILDRYIVSELATPFAFAIVAFTVFLIVNQFFLAADYVINKGVPFGLIMRYIVLQIPSLVYLILPFATLFGVLQGFGRLAGDNEMTAMRTSGISLSRIARPTILLGALLTILAFLTNEFIAPQSQHKAQTVLREILYHSSQPIIEPNQFVRTEDGQHSIFVGSMDPQSGLMHNVQIYSLGSGYFPETLTAQTGRQINGNLVLYNGVHSTYAANGLVTKQQRFDSLQFPLADASLLFEGPRGPFEMNSRELARQIRALKTSGEDVRQYEMNLQQKYAMPVAVLIGILIALPLGVRFGRRGRGVAAMIAVSVMVVYYLIQASTNALGKNGAIPTLVAAWIPNIVTSAVGLLMLWKEER